MNLQNLYKFKKIIGQNYLIFNLKYKFDLCSGYNYFNYISNDIDYEKSIFIKNINYLKKKFFIYLNFIFFNFLIKKIININISFNIIKIFIKNIKKIKKVFFKILISFIFYNIFKKNGKIFLLKIFKKKFFFPYPKVNIVKIYFKNVIKYFFLKINLNLFKINKLKSEKIKVFYNKIIILNKKNVFFATI